MIISGNSFSKKGFNLVSASFSSGTGGIKSSNPAVRKSKLYATDHGWEGVNTSAGLFDPFDFGHGAFISLQHFKSRVQPDVSHD